MNVVARIWMEIHAAPLSALFPEVIKNCNHKCPLSLFSSKYFEILIIMFSLYLKLVEMKTSDVCQLVWYAS